MIFDLAGKSVKDFSLDQVFMAEYVSPLFIYLLFDIRPSLIHGANASVKPMHLAAQWEYEWRTSLDDRHGIKFSLGAACWSFHYAKRIFETNFVHRFSHATMPLINLFKVILFLLVFHRFDLSVLHKELWLLLGIHCIGVLLRQSSEIHFAVLRIVANLPWLADLSGKFVSPRSPVSMPFHCSDSQISELGNFSIHVLLRNLRPAGSKERKIP